MVGGAQLADQAIARHVVLIVGGRALCTGVVIASDLVLTAAHCVLSNGKYRLLTFERRRSAIRDVLSVAPHPQFSPIAESPDLALVKLAAQAASKLAPVTLSERRAPPTVGDRFIVAGFGVGVQGDRRTAGKLRAASPGVGDEVLPFDDVERRVRSRARHHVAAIRAAVGAGLPAGHDLGPGQDPRQRQAGRDALGHHEDVGLDVPVVDRKHLAGPAEPGLDLVDDEQDAVLLGDLAQARVLGLLQTRDDGVGQVVFVELAHRNLRGVFPLLLKCIIKSHP